jgi:hypothetical protein
MASSEGERNVELVKALLHTLDGTVHEIKDVIQQIEHPDATTQGQASWLRSLGALVENFDEMMGSVYNPALFMALFPEAADDRTSTSL